MKKYLYLSMLALIAVMSLTLVSCGGDDDGTDEPSTGMTIQINGKSHKLAENEPSYVCFGLGAMIQFAIGKNANKYLEAYGETQFTFGIHTYSQEQNAYIYPTEGHGVGLDVSTLGYLDENFIFHRGMGLTVTNLNNENSEDEDLVYESGSLVIVAMEKGFITFKFDNLKMTSEGNSYTFNGTLKMVDTTNYDTLENITH